METTEKSNDVQKALAQTLVDAISSLHSNVYAIFIIGAGTALILKGFQAQGSALTTGGFALLTSAVNKGGQ